MNGPFLLAALLCAALGLALSSTPRAVVAAACAVLTTVAFAVSAWWQPALLPGGQARIACSVSIVATSAVVLLPNAIFRVAACALAANAGLWCGALVFTTGSPAILLALPLALLALPAGWVARRGYGIGLKVASSWLLAIGLMTAALPLLTTPGYEKAHME